MSMITLYIYCMLVRKIWKFIHPRVPYSLNPHAINVLLYRMKPRKHIHVKYCWQTYFKSIGALSQTFKNHIHNKVMRSECLTFSCQRTITLAGRPARLLRGWNMIFISRNMIFVLYDHVFWFNPLSNQINTFMVIDICGIIIVYMKR